MNCQLNTHFKGKRGHKKLPDHPSSIFLNSIQQTSIFQEFEANCAKELKKMDTHIIKMLDQKVIDQQSMLEKAGIPGFSVTVNSNEIQLQMYILDFIIKLKGMYDREQDNDPHH